MEEGRRKEGKDIGQDRVRRREGTLGGLFVALLSAAAFPLGGLFGLSAVVFSPKE